MEERREDFLKRRRFRLDRLLPATRFGWALAALAMVLILGAAAYAADPVLDQIFQIKVFPFGEKGYQVDEWAGVADKVPFNIIVPTYLPYGTQLKGVYVNEPPKIMDEEARKRATRATLTFSNGDEEHPASFNLDESIVVSTVGDKDAIPVMLKGVQGTLLENKERQFVAMSFAGCDPDFSMVVSTAGKLSREDAISIAESMLNCKKLGLKGSANK